MSIRSGRFFRLNETNDGSRIIVKTANKKNGGNIYRLFNSGEIALTVSVRGTDRQIAVNNSLDVMIGDAGDLEPKWTIPLDGGGKPIPSDVRCGYNFLGDENGSLESMEELRSGRFTGIPTAENRVIVDLGAGHSSRSSAFYRLFNSGDADVNFTVSGISGNVTLEPKSSIDIAVAAKGTIAVAGAATVDVIYDLLGGVGG